MNAAALLQTVTSGRELRRLRVGIVDSGLDGRAEPGMRVVAARRFVQDTEGVAEVAQIEPDALGHGSALAQIILEDNPCIDLVIAQVFGAKRMCSSAQVAAALDWLTREGVVVANLSFGINAPDATLRHACERAASAGMVLVSSAPARGAPTFPAAYPFCIAVSGDARCDKDQISWLGSPAVDFGAYPFATPADPRSGGASFAAARVAARVARLLVEAAAVSDIPGALRAQCSYHGPEVRHPDTVNRAAAAATIARQS